MKIPSLAINYIHRSLGRSALLSVLVLLGCFALSPHAQAACRQGCDTNTGSTVLGDDALVNNTIGTFNTAIGAAALGGNTTGAYNTAIGAVALASNTASAEHTAVGGFALASFTNGNGNTAVGYKALSRSTIISNNTAVGWNALSRNTTGSNNIALGSNAGLQLTTGSNNIDIGNPGLAGNDSSTIRIGRQEIQNRTFIAGISGATVTGSAVAVNSSGQLGVAPSSQRFKQNIQTMGDASDILLALRPVSFKYKPDLDPKGIPQFGLVAEDVEKVSPDLVARDDNGKPYTVRYEAVNAMLLNEFLEEHKAFLEEHRAVEELKKQVATLAAGLQKVSAQLAEESLFSGGLEVSSRRMPQVVLNNQ